MSRHLMNSLDALLGPNRWFASRLAGTVGGPSLSDVDDRLGSAGATARRIVARQVPAYAGLLATFMLLVTLRSEEAFAGLFLLPIFLAGRGGVRAGLVAAVLAALLQLMVMEATHGEVFGDGSWPYILTTWTLFVGAGAFSGALFRYLDFLERRSLSVEVARAAEDAALAEIGRVISSSPDIRRVYTRFGEAVSKLVPFDRITISLPDTVRGLYTIAYTAGVEIEGKIEGSEHLL